MEKKKHIYFGVVRPGAVRDAEICLDTEHDPLNDDSWVPVKEAEIFLGQFEAYDDADALRQAAEYAGTDPENIRLIPISEAQ